MRQVASQYEGLVLRWAVVKRLLAAIGIVLSLVTATPVSAQQSAPAPACQFVLGFAVLEQAVPQVGECQENQHFADNGDAQQQTVGGLLVWRKADNWTAFTDGYRTWLNGPNGIQQRLNTERFPWEAASPATNGRSGPSSAYPDASMTPGAVDTRVTQTNLQQTICVSGYTATVRPPTSYTTPLKVKQIAAYGFADRNTADYEEDHFIPLEIGGNPTDPMNLWPEAYAPAPGSHEKDRVENYLHDQVCSGGMTLAEAQQAVTTDWVAVYQKIAGVSAVTSPLPSVASVPTPSGSGGDGHTYYASTFRTASDIYCDTDPGWKSLSNTYLTNYPSLDAALAALGAKYHLHRPC